jgi:hypothetical protein
MITFMAKLGVLHNGCGYCVMWYLSNQTISIWHFPTLCNAKISDRLFDIPIKWNRVKIETWNYTAI